MVYLTGDTHGDLDRFRHGRLRWLGKRDIVVVLGDFGFVWDGGAEEQKKLDWLRKRPYTLLFLDGSHENYDLLAQYPTVELFGGKVQALGGNLYHVCRGSVLELGKPVPAPMPVKPPIWAGPSASLLLDLPTLLSSARPP